MSFSHDTLVAFSKSYGLFYMMIVFFGAGVYALWPSNREKFKRAKNSILEEDED